MRAGLAVACLLAAPAARALIRALDTAATGMAVQEARVNTISNNIANVGTTGYKRQRAESEDLLYETVVEAGARTSNDTLHNVGVQIGSGARISGIRRQFSQGGPVVTDRPYDLMIDGEGFFAVERDGVVLYTRDGSFDVDAQGVVVTRTGHRLLPGLTVPGDTVSVAVGKNGEVEAYARDRPEPDVLGQVPVAVFMNPAGLMSESGNLYRPTLGSGEPVMNVPGENGAGRIVQGSLESSNVSVMTEMTDLIRAQRSYEMNAKVMTAADQMLQTVNGLR